MCCEAVLWRLEDLTHRVHLVRIQHVPQTSTCHSEILQLLELLVELVEVVSDPDFDILVPLRLGQPHDTHGKQSEFVRGSNRSAHTTQHVCEPSREARRGHQRSQGLSEEVVQQVATGQEQAA